jgi:hypothetical protein
MSEKRRLSSANALAQGIISDSNAHILLKQRLLDLPEFNGVIPLTRSESFFSAHRNIVGLHDFAYLDLKEFTTMTNEKNIESEAGPRSIWPGKGQSWTSSLQLIGFSRKNVERVMQASITYNKCTWIWPPALRDDIDMPESSNAIIDIVKRLCSCDLDAFKELRRLHMLLQKEGRLHWKCTRQRLLLPSTSSNFVDLMSPPAPKRTNPSGAQHQPGSSSSSEINPVPNAEELRPDLLVSEPEDVSRNELYLSKQDLFESFLLDNKIQRHERLFLDVHEIISRGALIPEEIEPLSSLLSSIKKTDVVEGLQSINVGSDTYFSFSHFRGTGKKTGQRQARILSHLLKLIGISQHGMSSFLRRHASEIKEALPAAHIEVGPARLNAEETAQIQAGMSKSNYQSLAAQLNSRGHRVFAPWNQVKQLKEDNMNERVFVFETVGVSGTKGKEEECKMIVATQDVLTLLASELEVRLKNGDLISDFRLRDFPVDADFHDLPIALSQDSGQGSVKAFIHLVGVRGSCSAFKSRIPWMYDQASQTQKRKPNDAPSNWKKAIAETDGWTDMNELGVIQLEKRFCVVPWLAIPSGAIPYVYALRQDIEALKSHRCGERIISVSQSEARRAACVRDSLVFLLEGNLCLGVRFVSEEVPGISVDVAYSFKRPVEVDPRHLGMANVRKYKVRAMICTDLLSFCAGAGCEHESPFICCLCNQSPSEFKKDSQNPDAPLVLRTLETQAQNLAAYNALPANKKKAVNGVNGVPCWPKGIPYSQVIAPPLHCDLGIINRLLKIIREFIAELEGQDPAAAARLRELEEDLIELASMLEDQVEALEFLLNESGKMSGLDDQVGSVARAAVDELLSQNEEKEVPDLYDGPVEDGPWETFFQASLIRQEELEVKATELRERGADRVIATRSTRQIQIDADAANKLELLAEEIDIATTDLLTTLTMEQEIRAELAQLARAHEIEAGPLQKALDEFMVENNIFQESYHGGQMNGPSARRLIHLHEEIHQRLRDAMLQGGYGDANLTKLNEHMQVWRHYSECSRLMRSTDMLSDAQLDLLSDSAIGFGKAYRQANGIGSMFHKAHLVERHVPGIARRFGTIGKFSEEGGESVHVWYKRAALMCRTMKNSAARIRATLRQLESKQVAGEFKREIKRRNGH